VLVFLKDNKDTANTNYRVSFLKDNYRKISSIFCLPTTAFMSVILLRIGKLVLRHFRPVHKQYVCSLTNKKLWPKRTKMTRRVKP